jgi:hypothetical protein
VPLGSKNSWLMFVHMGQGTLTAATAWAPADNPVPAHFSVTFSEWPHVQQAKSRITFSSIIMLNGLFDEERQAAPVEVQPAGDT